VELDFVEYYPAIQMNFPYLHNNKLWFWREKNRPRFGGTRQRMPSPAQHPDPYDIYISYFDLTMQNPVEVHVETLRLSDVF
jgi:hypothetical protein